MYNIYISENKEVTNMDMLYQTEAKKEEELSYKISDLEPNKIYYVRIFAVNAIGEGYPAEESSFVRTMDDTLNEPGSLYVWGNNQSSELGLTDAHVALLRSYTVRVKMTLIVSKRASGAGGSSKDNTSAVGCVKRWCSL